MALSVSKKTHICTRFNVYIYLNDALLFQNKENEILFGPPPPKKKAEEYEYDMSTRTSVSLYQQTGP